VERFRSTGPLPIECSHCGHLYGFGALHPFLDKVELGFGLVPKAQREGGFMDFQHARTPGGNPIGITYSYHPDSPEWKQQAKRRIVATGIDRYTFYCDCGRTHVLKDPTLLDRYIGAVGEQQDKLSL
jgi:hypothetical protein